MTHEPHNGQDSRQSSTPYRRSDDANNQAYRSSRQYQRVDNTSKSIRDGAPHSADQSFTPRNPYNKSTPQSNISQRPNSSPRPARAEQRYSFKGQYHRSAADDRAMAESSRQRQQQGCPTYNTNQHQHYAAMSTAADSYRNTSRYANTGQTKQPVSLKPLFIIAAILIVIFCAVFFWIRSLPIEVTVNGTPIEVSGKKTAQYIYEQGVVHVNPGDFVDIEGVVLETGKGETYALTINGEPGNPTKRLSKGDDIVFSDGNDIEEESVVLDEQSLPYKVIEIGHGPIHKITQEGIEGKATTKTGSVSQKTLTTETLPAQDKIYQRYYPNTNGEKVVAFTFDDGPWGSQTTEILDILEKYQVKATFFTVGRLIKDEGVAQMQRAAEAGHLVCTHTWDHAAGSGQGTNLSYMSQQEQRDEIIKGHDAIKSALGVEPLMYFRAPGGNYPLEVWQNTEDLVAAEIGWDIDTEDWRQPGTDTIVNRLKTCTPGDIVLMHDGGGDRSQTIAALDEAIPYLLENGYRFITIDELMKYPPKTE